jgi:hypothetical protein
MGPTKPVGVMPWAFWYFTTAARVFGPKFRSVGDNDIVVGHVLY